MRRSNQSKKKLFARLELIGAGLYVAGLLVALFRYGAASLAVPFAGFAIALCWEMSHYYFDNISVDPIVDKVMPGPIYPMIHAVYDSILFVLIWLAARAVTGTECSYSLKHFATYLALGVGQAILFELMFAGGKVWRYKTGKGYVNKRITKSLTLLPVAEWFVASIVWFLIVPTLRRCK